MVRLIINKNAVTLVVKMFHYDAFMWLRLAVNIPNY